MSDPVDGVDIQAVSPVERYERGTALKKAGLYKAAIEQFELATGDRALAVKAHA